MPVPPVPFGEMKVGNTYTVVYKKDGRPVTTGQLTKKYEKDPGEWTEGPAVEIDGGDYDFESFEFELVALLPSPQSRHMQRDLGVMQCWHCGKRGEAVARPRSLSVARGKLVAVISKCQVGLRSRMLVRGTMCSFAIANTGRTWA